MNSSKRKTTKSSSGQSSRSISKRGTKIPAALVVKLPLGMEWVEDIISLAGLAGSVITFPSTMSTHNAQTVISDLKAITLRIELLYFLNTADEYSMTLSETITNQKSGVMKSTRKKSANIKKS